MSTGAASTTAVPLAAPRRLARVPPAEGTDATAEIVRIDGSVPLRMPAILRLQQPKAQRRSVSDPNDRKSTASTPSSGRPGHGKRRQRRYENAQLAGNPHLHRPTRADFSPGPYMKDLSTKFAPPPKSFSRSTYISSTIRQERDTGSAEAGHYAMSMRGLRKTLRAATGSRRGGRTEEVLDIMERELGEWLGMSGRIPEGFYHDSTAYAGSSLRQATRRGKPLDPTPLEDLHLEPEESLPDAPASHGVPTLDVPTLTELARQPHALVWLAPSSHHRFLLHCLARYYDLSSFSRPLSPLEPDVRVTHVLRPQLVRSGRNGTTDPTAHGLETPPGTDWSTAGGTTTEGELTADTLTETETESVGFSSGTEEEDDGPEDVRQEPTWTTSDVSGTTDDEAEAVYSSATDSDRDVDSLASSFADLAAGTPQRPTTPAFVAVTTPMAGTATPTRPAFAPSPLSLLGSATPRTVAERGRTTMAGRRSLPGAGAGAGNGPGAMGGYTSTESSPSRSPTRAATATTATFVGTAAGEWKMPTRRFVDWIYE